MANDIFAYILGGIVLVAAILTWRHEHFSKEEDTIKKTDDNKLNK